MITGFYAAICAGFMIFLAFRIIRLRWREKVSLGDGGHSSLNLAIRAHGNFVEFAPIFLILLFLCEYQGLYSILVHLAGILFLIGRSLHAYAIYNKLLKPRVIGMIMTFCVIGILSVIAAAQYCVTLL